MLLRKIFFITNNNYLIRHYAKAAFIRVKSPLLDNIFIEPVEKINWNLIRKEILQIERTVNNGNIDSILITKFFNGARLDIALSYIDYLKSNSISLNDVSISKIVRLFYSYYVQNEKISEEHEKQIIDYCNQIIGKHEIIDASVAENLLHGLSLTKEWKKGFSLMEQIRLGEKTPSRSSYSCLIVKAIKEGCNEIVWKTLQEMSKQQIVPRSQVFIEWFKKNSEDYDKIETMFEYIKEQDLLLPETEISKISEVLNKSFDCSLVNINRKGKCPSCEQKLPGIKIMKSEFDKMAAKFLTDIFIKNDVFLKTNPGEIERFKELVEKSIPFDFVIDGLNVAYSQGNQLSSKIYSKILANVVKYCVDNNQKCLVIGRQHMRLWPKQEMSYIRQKSVLFLADDNSSDDLFLLYAALKSGPQTNLFSRDFMRQHSHLLEEKMKRIFRRWQQEHQYQLIKVKNSHKVIVKEPIFFELRAHKVSSNWHIPFTNESVSVLAIASFNLPSSFLCLKKSVKEI